MRHRVMFILFLLGIVFSFGALKYYPGSSWKANGDRVRGTIFREVWNKDGEFIFKPQDSFFRILVKGIENSDINGKIVEIEGAFYRPEGARNPGGYDNKKYLLGKNVAFVIDNPSVVIIRKSYSLRATGAVIREYIERAVSANIHENHQGLVTGVMTGDTSSISKEEKQWIRLSGISHIMAVSGTHVTYILTPVKSLVKRKKFDIAFRSGLCIIPLFLFVTIAGFTPSVLRAGVMCGTELVSKVLGRRNDPLNSIGIAGVACLLVYPFAAADVGFLLSFGAVLSGMVLNPLLKSFVYKNKEPVKCLDGLFYGISVNIGIIPVMMYYFNMVSPAGIIITLLAAPLSAVMCVFGYVMVALYYIPFLTGFSKILAMGLTSVTKALSSLAEFGAGVKGVYTVSPGVIFFTMYYGMIIFIAIVIKKRKVNKKYICAFLAIVVISTIIPEIKSNDLKITWLDVGQGSSALVETSEGCVLIDGGNGYTDVSSILWKNGIRTLAFVILSHGDSDHCEGLFKVLEEHPVENLILPDNPEDKGAGKLLDTAKNKRVNIIRFSGQGEFVIGEVLFRLACFIDNDSLNNSSVVVQLTLESNSFLFPGDLDLEGEEVLSKEHFLKKCLAVTASHHGSGRGTGRDLLSSTYPRIGVISVGKNNMYGHPHKDVLERFSDYGSYVFRTDEDGAVVLTIDKKENLKVVTWLKKENIQFKK